MSGYRLVGILLAYTAATQARITQLLTDHSGQNILVTTTLRVPGMPAAALANSTNFVRLQANGTPAGAVVASPSTALLGFSPDGSAVSTVKAKSLFARKSNQLRSFTNGTRTLSVRRRPI